MFLFRLLILGGLIISVLQAVEAGATIDADLTLQEDLILTEAGDGLVVGANGITIDGNGHALVCAAPMGLEVASTGSETIAGIRLGSHRNVTIRNFSRISGFFAGVEADGGSGTVIEACVLSGNGRGVLIDNGSLTVRDCTITDAFIGLEATYYADSLTFVDNHISDCVWSIRYAGTPRGTCSDNRIERCCDRDAAHATDGSPILAGMLVETERPVHGTIGDPINISVHLRTPMGTSSPASTCTASVVPERPVTVTRDGALATIGFTPQRQGLHSVLVTTADAAGNQTTHRYPVLVGAMAERTVDCRLRYDGPFYGQSPDRWDTGSMSFAGPIEQEDVFCGGWVQFSANDLPPTPVAVITGASVSALLGFKTDYQDQFDNRLGLQRMATFDSLVDSVGDIPEDFGETNWPSNFFWGSFPIDPVVWSMDERHAWHAVSLKLIGRLPQIRCGKPDEMSRVTFSYQVPISPEVMAIDDRAVRLLAATSTAGGDAELVLGGPAPASTITLADWPEAFLDVATTFSAAESRLSLPAIGNQEHLRAVPLRCAADEEVTITVTEWESDEGATRSWILSGSGSVALTIDGLTPVTAYSIRAGESTLASARSDTNGRLTCSLTALTQPTSMHLETSVGDRQRSIRCFAPGVSQWQRVPQHGAVQVDQTGTRFLQLGPETTYQCKPLVIGNGDA